MGLTLDGGMDRIASCLEVYYGAADNLELLENIALYGIELAISGLERVVGEQDTEETEEILGLATDLGGYAIMAGGTNGGHLTSFSLVEP